MGGGSQSNQGFLLGHEAGITFILKLFQMRVFFLAIVLLSTVLCEEDIEKYVSPCPGSVNVEGSTYRAFVDKYVNLTGDLVTKCKEEYFSSIPTSCDDSHKECVVAHSYNQSHV